MHNSIRPFNWSAVFVEVYKHKQGSNYLVHWAPLGPVLYSRGLGISFLFYQCLSAAIDSVDVDKPWRPTGKVSNTLHIKTIRQLYKNAFALK